MSAQSLHHQLIGRGATLNQRFNEPKLRSIFNRLFLNFKDDYAVQNAAASGSCSAV